MSSIARFAKYAAAFEVAYESDDWAALAPWFAEDAVYEVHGVPAPLGGRFQGRAAVLAYFKSVLDGFDRRFESREIALVKGPREEGRSVWVRGKVAYVAAGAPDLVFELEETTTFDADGRISRLDDRYDDETIRAITEYVDTHGAKLGIGRKDMARYRNALPQLGERLFLTDGGIETTLIFHDGLELPDFAAYDLLRRPGGDAALAKYFRSYAELARRFEVGLVLESATWRASRDWAERLGHTPAELAELSRAAIRQLEAIRAEFETAKTPIVISGCLGPRGDGYDPAKRMSAEEAEAYHLEQAETFAASAADLLTAITMNYTEEAIGIARAAKRVGMPVVISFTVETDGRLPTGDALAAAITQVDAATGSYPAYYMINCAHPTHFESVLSSGEAWAQRIRGLRANASRMSHAELNESPTLDEGDPVELGREYAALKRRLPKLSVMGGCCGTDHRHVEQIAGACAPLFK